jgi:predicted kinase
MRKIILTKGLPGSGKTFWAKEFQKENPNFKRINKDDLRAMLDNGKWTKDNEKFVLYVRDVMIQLALNDGYDVIIDDTNLHPKHEQQIREILKSVLDGAQVIIQDFTHVPLKECIVNDLKRLNSVGKDVIMKMYNQFLKPPPAIAPEIIEGVPDAIICDLDGTLCLLNGRSPYDASTCENDGVNLAVSRILTDSGIADERNGELTHLIFVSGREDKYREETLKFFEKNDLNEPDELFMRPTGDTRKDSILKKEIYDTHIKGKYNIKYVLDDRDSVVSMWREQGLTCLQVAPGDF